MVVVEEEKEGGDEIVVGCPSGETEIMTMSSCSSPSLSLRRHWWMTNRKVAEKNVKEAQVLLASHDQAQKQAALGLLDASISLCPRWDVPLHLKASALLRFRRYRDIADLFRDDIPSARFPDDSTSSSSSDSLCRESLNLLPPTNSAALTRCFSVSDLVAGNTPRSGRRSPNNHHQQHWRYLILGQALSHLGLLEEALLLLQAGKRLSSAASRRDSVLSSDDVFAAFDGSGNAAATELDSATQILANVKFLLRRRAAALAALDAGIPPEAVRHLSKILDGSRRAVPQAFLADCYTLRAAAYRAGGRIPESIADCNRALALDPTCVEALSARASLLEHVQCFTECLQDLEHLKLLYDSILREQKLPGPAWRRAGRGGQFSTGDVAASSRSVAGKIAEMKRMVVAGSLAPVDYHALLGLRRGCSRSELECAYRLLCLRHRPDRATMFVDRCEFAEDRDADGVRDQAKMSALLLYRLLQKAYADVMAAVLEEEAAEKRKHRAAAAATAAAASASAAAAALAGAKATATVSRIMDVRKGGRNRKSSNCSGTKQELPENSPVSAAFPGGFCREIMGAGGILSPGFAHQAHHLHETLSC